MLEFIVGMFVGIGISYVFYRLLIIWTLRQIANIDEVLQTIKETHVAKLIPARVEEHNGIFYVYNAEDDTFLVQGSNLQELKDKLEKSYQDKKIVVTEGEESVLTRLKDTGIAQS